jgi:carboxylate-amine ligase
LLPIHGPTAQDWTIEEQEKPQESNHNCGEITPDYSADPKESAISGDLSMGIEEEFFIVHSDTGLISQAGLPGFDTLKRRRFFEDPVAGFDSEFQLSIVESRTGVCLSIEQVRLQLTELRSALSTHAHETERSIVSAGTLPILDWRDMRITDESRYSDIASYYRDVVMRRATCGCHVHIGVQGRDRAIRALSRAQPWLPILLALSASSPFFEGFDTGYESYRSTLWGGFPVAGPIPYFDSYSEYLRAVNRLVRTGAMLDAGHIYWDIRPGNSFETVEFRVADGCTTVDEVLLQALLCRALMSTCLKETDGEQGPGPVIRSELQRAAVWRAARSGMSDVLIDVCAEEAVPAREMLARFLEYITDSLEELDSVDMVRTLVEQVQRSGTSALRQRRKLEKSGNLHDVIAMLVMETEYLT